jgi:CysZ protein
VRPHAADLAERGRTGLATGRAELAHRTTQATGAVKRGAAATAGKAVSTGRNFAVGAACFWHGLRTFLTSPVLWLLALVPIVAVHVVLGVVDTTVNGMLNAVLDRVEGLFDWLPGALTWIARQLVKWSILALVEGVVGFVALPLSVVFGAAGYVVMARRVERRLPGPGRPLPGWFGAACLAIWHTALILLVVNLGWLLILPLIAIPGVGLLAATAIVVVFDGFFVAVQAVAIPLHHRGLRGLRAYTGFCWRNRAAALGFGLVSVLILMIPFHPLRWFSVPAIFIGAVLLVRRIEGLPVSRDRNLGVPVTGVEVGAGTALRPVGTGYEHVAQEPQQRQHPDAYPH